MAEDQFGITYGSKLIGTGFETLVDGLTISRFLLVKVPTASAGNAFVRAKTGGAVGEGLLIESGDPHVRLDTARGTDTLQVRGTAVGSCISYIGIQDT
jgi:hypothetical protein